MGDPAAALSAGSGNIPSGSGIKKDESLDDMLQRLWFDEGEIDDLVFEEEKEVPKEGMKWLTLARVHTSNYFSFQTFEQHMIMAWSPAREVKFRALEENLFTIQCSCMGNWIKVIEGGPWLFRQNVIIIEPYDGLVPEKSIELTRFSAWVQIHNLPEGYRNENLIKNLAAKKFASVEKVETLLQGVGNFVRVKVRVNVESDLPRFVTISRNGQREFFKILYEKFPRFCGACGLLGHVHTECGTGEHDESKLRWGDWLKADRENWRRFASSGNRGGRGAMGGRRGGRDAGGRDRGRGEWVDWRSHPERTREFDNDLKDTASSTIKTNDLEMTDADMAAKRRLDFGEKSIMLQIILLRMVP
jgi:hypothetical protein